MPSWMFAANACAGLRESAKARVPLSGMGCGQSAAAIWFCSLVFALGDGGASRLVVPGRLPIDAFTL